MVKRLLSHFRVSVKFLIIMSKVKRNTYTIVLVGDSQVGKSCMVHKLCYGTIPIDYNPTIEDLHTTIVMTEKVEIIDTSPSDLAQILRRTSLKEADAVMIVYDSQDCGSTDNLFWHLEELTSVHEWISFTYLPTVCLLVGVAKHVGCLDCGAVENAKQFANLWGIEHVNVRMKSTSIRTAFEKCVFLIEERKALLMNQKSQERVKCQCCVIL